MDIDVRTISRSNRIAGIAVKTSDDRPIGKIHTIGLHRENHRLAFAVVMIEHLPELMGRPFVVSGRALSLKHDGEQPFFVLNLSPDVLKRATAFRKYYWPGIINPQWAAEIDAHDQSPGQSGQTGDDAYLTDACLVR